MTISILALDLARVTGWAALAPGEALPRVGVQELGPDAAHELTYTRALRSWLVWRLPALAWGGGLVAYERALHVPGRGNRWQRSAWLEHELLEACERWGVPSISVVGSALKKHAAGSGRADKDAVRAAVIARWPGLRTALEGLTHDASDALAVLGWALDELALGAQTGGEQGIDPAAVIGGLRVAEAAASGEAESGDAA